ncbi:MAG: hypothetical protein V5B60_18675 [Accumulibacter sp.]|jgi:hypothetical protein|uniref:hypothetical protein n=1 Tax=Accumulibacter sp. TaxID=2053492 RepID=UPI002FC366EB
MINLLGAALIGLSSPVIPHNVATLGMFPSASEPPVVVQPPAHYGGGGGGFMQYRLPDNPGMPASSRIIILTAIALTEILQ